MGNLVSPCDNGASFLYVHHSQKVVRYITQPHHKVLYKMGHTRLRISFEQKVS
jgi:hypothetical protein